MKNAFAAATLFGALTLGGCGTYSSLTHTPIGPVAHVEVNGPSGYREITCVGKVHGGQFKSKHCQSSAGRSIGHSVATAVAGSLLPAAIHGTAIFAAAGRSGPAVVNQVNGAVAISDSRAAAGANAGVFYGH